MRTPVEVVEAALANWGDEKAQAAFAEVVKRLLDVEQERDEDQGVIRVWRGRCERAEADNAALLELVKDVPAFLEGVAASCLRRGLGMEFEPSPALMSAISNPHPGAALLEELEGLRKQVAGARDAALEEAARVLAADGAPIVREMQHVIRALKKTGQGE